MRSKNGKEARVQGRFRAGEERAEEANCRSVVNSLSEPKQFQYFSSEFVFPASLVTESPFLHEKMVVAVFFFFSFFNILGKRKCWEVLVNSLRCAEAGSVKSRSLGGVLPGASCGILQVEVAPSSRECACPSPALSQTRWGTQGGAFLCLDSTFPVLKMRRAVQ